MAESFFHTLKTALIYLEDYDTHEQARTAVFAYIEVFYNRQRCHAANGYLAPLVYEQALKRICPPHYEEWRTFSGGSLNSCPIM